jgi:hypothetical protein
MLQSLIYLGLTVVITKMNFYPQRFMTGVRDRKVGKSEGCDRVFRIERFLLYLMSQSGIVMNKVGCSECMSIGIFTEKNGMRLAGSSKKNFLGDHNKSEDFYFDFVN